MNATREYPPTSTSQPNMSTGKDFLAPPTDGLGHAQEATLVDHQHERSTTLASGSGTEFEMLVSDATPVTSPGDYAKPPAPPPRDTFSTSSCPPIIPPPGDRTFKTLVLCFDGTGDQFDLDNSNIVQLVSLLKKDDKTKQMVYYQVSGRRHHRGGSATHTFA